MSFDLDNFSMEVALEKKYIDEMCEDFARIQERKDSRRLIVDAQVKSDEIKSKLCDKIREEKQKVPGLDKRISRLENEDPELFSYIRKLEFIQNGIWCSTCQKIKEVNGVQRSPLSVASKGSEIQESTTRIPIEGNTMQIFYEKIKKLQNEHAAALSSTEELNVKNDENSKKIQFLLSCINKTGDSITRLQNEISELKRKISLPKSLPDERSAPLVTHIAENEKFSEVPTSDDLLRD